MDATAERRAAAAADLLAAQAAEAARRSEPPAVSAPGFAYKTMRISPTCLTETPWAVLTRSGIVLALARSKDEAKAVVNWLLKS